MSRRCEKMRLLKTHSHTSERPGNEADKERQEKGKERTPISKGQGKRRRSPARGDRARCVNGNAKNQSSATTLARGGEAKFDRRKRENKSHTVLCHSRSSHNTQIASGSERGGIGRTKNKISHAKPIVVYYN